MAILAEEAAVSHTTMEEHPANSLVRDERVQRSLRPVRVRALAANLDLDGIGVITVSRRADGRLVILDGQHRIQALIDAGMGEWPVTCRVYHGLDVAREAALFRVLNNTSKTTAIEDLIKGITAGDPESVAISHIAARNNLWIALQSGEGLISCAAAMRKIYRSSAGTGPAALGFALHIATSAWGTHSDAVEGHIVSGLGTVYLRYGEEVDRAALIRKLAKYRGGAPGLLGQAKSLRAMRPATVGRCVAMIVVDIYNNGRRDRLPAL